MKEEFQHTVFDFTLQPGVQDFWVITAWNPDSQTHADSFNKAADEKLEQVLKDEGFVHFRVTGGSPDGLHAEPGWGIYVMNKPPCACVRNSSKTLFFIFREIASH